MRRILTIDGGGIKGVFPASFLAHLEEGLNESISTYFDLIVGTSTGGILAIGLGLGFSAAEVLQLYESMGPGVFEAPRPWVTWLGFARYSQKPLRESLQRYFGDRLLGESKVRLVIPSFDVERGEVHIYKTAHHERFERDYKVKAVDVALATAAAPTYFPIQVAPDGEPLVDGGIYANNPVGLAVAEAIGVLEWPKEDLFVLSLGCTSTPYDRRARWRLFGGDGLGYWGPKMVDLLMRAQSSASLGTAYTIVGRERVVRINPSVALGRFSLASSQHIVALKGLGSSYARDEAPLLKSRFFTIPAEAFHAIRQV
jgi:patatin-like phospholipase/acyl hydrolase